MSVEKRDFYGKEVTDAIKSACESFNVAQEMLDIEVIETGSTGIFGLIRKKARIRVSLKEEVIIPRVSEEVIAAAPEPVIDKEPEQTRQEKPVEVAALETEADLEPDAVLENGEDEDDEDDDEAVAEEEEADASTESLEIVRAEVTRLVELMGFPSNVVVTSEGLSVHCKISGEFDEELAGPEGKTLDSIQYLIRKIIARKCSERLRVTINVGDFRERRLEDLKERAVELAGKVKETGKTQVLPALNPSERREIHMVLQEDKEVRSRSVGDGLFKKILIYKPGKGNRGGRKKSSPRNRRGKGNKSRGPASEE
jgi:spoIIIJ-associated protein